MQISQSFTQANGAIGANWAAIVANNAESGPNTFQGSILVNGNGYGPINTFGGDAAALWAGGGSFGNNQWAQCVVNSVAPFTATLSITAAAQSGSNTTFTYTVTQGSVAAAITGGALTVKVTGMVNAGNNKTFTATTFGSGTFTVANASGVTESGSSGVGKCPSDSGAGVMVRGQGTTAATLNGYFWHVGTNSFGGGGRIAYYELWKVVNGVGTNLFNAGDTGIALVLPVIGDVLSMSANGNTITAFYNGVVLAQVTDSSIPTGGVPGITSWAMNGPNEYVYANWPTSSAAAGNNGTTMRSFSAGDTALTDTQLASDTLKEGVVSTQLLADLFPYANGNLHTQNANWVFGAGTLQVSANKVFASSASVSSAFRSDQVWPADQYSETTMVIGGTAAVQNGGPAVRVAAGATTFYGVQCASATFALIKEVAGTLTSLGTNAVFPVTGDVIRLQVVGNTLTVFKNGVAVTGMTNIVDNSIASGNAGLWGVGNSTTNGYSTWAGGSVQGVPSQFTTEVGAFLSDTTAGAYPVGFVSGQAFAYQNSVSWPNDQYSEVKMTGASIVGSQQVGPAVRIATGAVTFYQFYPLTGSLARITKAVAGTITVLNTVAYTFTQNDVFRLEVIGSMLIGKVNGTPIISAFDSSIASGKAGFLGQNTAGNPATPSGTFSNWSAGSTSFTSSISGNAGIASALVSYTGTASGSVTADGSGNYTITGLANGSYTITPSLAGFTFAPTNSAQTVNNANITGVNFVATAASTVFSVTDSRNYGNFPNHSRNVQNTLTYDVPSVDSRAAGAPVDSRAAGAPVDSRIAPNIPENSRTD